MLHLSAVPLTRYQLPGDKETVSLSIVSAIDKAQTSLRLFMYGWTWKPSMDAIVRAHQRGVDCWLALDHTQSCGTKEAAMLHYLMLQGFPPERVIITTSPVHREIMHEKVCVLDGQIVLEGSYNWSDSGLDQVNSFYLYESPELAAAYTADHEALVQWAVATEPGYQEPSSQAS
jgi:phosphatidylserine/phosphatidylglycerophosphate/cardiolipin synthase-like enzyme